jgi:hypothetical protein
VFSTEDLQIDDGQNVVPMSSPSTPTLGSVGSRKSHLEEIPLVWANEKWKSYSHNRSLRPLLNTSDLKVLNVWLKDEHQSNSTLSVTIHLSGSVSKKLDLVRVPFGSTTSHKRLPHGTRQWTVIIHAIERPPTFSCGGPDAKGQPTRPIVDDDYVMESVSTSLVEGEMVSPLTDLERDPFRMSDGDEEESTAWNEQFVGDRRAVVSIHHRCLLRAHAPYPI